MKLVGKALSRIGITGVIVAAALTTAVATAGSASAERVHGGYYSTERGCYLAGSNAVEQGHARDYNCAYRDAVPHWHLILFT